MREIRSEIHEKAIDEATVRFLQVFLQEICIVVPEIHGLREMQVFQAMQVVVFIGIPSRMVFLSFKEIIHANGIRRGMVSGVHKILERCTG